MSNKHLYCSNIIWDGMVKVLMKITEPKSTFTYVKIKKNNCPF